jgi:type IV secretion system protein VirB10
MLIMDVGGGGGGAEQKSANNALDASDPNRAFISNVLKATSAEQQKAERLSNLNRTIAQGKIINSVLETAVNTDLPGQLRAIVSRDIYPESGRNVLIPKGSRLIGVYNSVIRRGQTRVLIVWSRLIRPDGVDIMIGSPAIDSLGRAGVNGIVDNKYSEIFSAALLTSVITIGIATSVEAISGDETTTTTNANGTTTTGGAGAIAAAGAVANIGNIGKDIVNTMLDLKPTVTIDQGTRVDVFVNRDLIFPGSTANTQFIE